MTVDPKWIEMKARLQLDLDWVNAIIHQAETAPAETSTRPPLSPQVTSAFSLAKFFDHMRSTKILGPTLDQSEVQGCELTLKWCSERHFVVSWAAYILATKYHETAGTMRPIREYGRGAGRPYGKPGKHNGQIAYGRGDVQLTWDYNYQKADDELNLGGRLVGNYELALDPDIAAEIAVRGMEYGWFTGKKLQDYLPAVADVHQFSNARRIINGLDKAVLIAGYALEFQSALQSAEWSQV